jgi:hypothetical protein
LTSAQMFWKLTHYQFYTLWWASNYITDHKSDQQPHRGIVHPARFLHAKSLLNEHIWHACRHAHVYCWLFI